MTPNVLDHVSVSVPVSRSTPIKIGPIYENHDEASKSSHFYCTILCICEQVKQTEVTIKVSHDGLTVTDNWRKLFFRRHYPFYSVSYCSTDPLQR
ncbi:Tensin-1 [Fasciola gigantica]|uniref:Tensin-1 n=1 Tax=Fasciola gigantica TaxID=46835 RepID=A0A504YL88_FASGI|nr:Tensin-1 [Fasciola gigantica]